MDRNTVIGLGLMFLLTLAYFYFFAPQPETRPAEPQAQTANVRPPDSLSSSSAQSSEFAASNTSPLSKKSDSLNTVLYGPFAKALSDSTPQPVEVVTDVLRLRIHPKGAQIRPVELRMFKTWEQKPLHLVTDHPSNQLSFQFRYRGQIIDSQELVFQPSIQHLEVTGTGIKRLHLRAELGRDTFIEHIFTFSGSRYDFGHTLKLKGLENVLTDNYLYLTHIHYAPQTEKSAEKMLPEIQLCYKYLGEKGVDRLDVVEDEVVVDRPTRDIEWIACKNQFFTLALISDDRFQNASLSIVPKQLLDQQPALNLKGMPLATPAGALKLLRVEAALPLKKGESDSVSFRLFYGPNDISLMQSYNNRLDRVIQLGWGPLRYIALFIHYIFQLLESVISNYGLIILILAFLIKIILHPLTFRSFRSTAKMQVVNEMPEMKELEAKYSDNPTELQQRKLAFYNQLGISPLGGCIPLLLQFPILISMFNFFPQSIELRQKSFLWADDLSTYDSVFDFGFNVPFYGDHVSLFTLLMTISTIAYTWMQQKTQATNTPTQLKVISYLMPIVFLGILNNYSAGLSYYYLVFNILTIGHTQIVKQFIDKDKLHAQILEARNKKSKQPPGRFQRWIIEQQKKQQQLQQQQRSRKR
jgi:YidC/Oxa1 family membrane protein insertase